MESGLIVISELAAISRAEIEALKAFISRQEERFRPSYGRDEVVEPRQMHLQSAAHQPGDVPQGRNRRRRFWPSKVGKIDVAALRRDRDQLFAEAAVRYGRGEKWWPAGEFERTHIKAKQQARYEGDPWEQPGPLNT